MAPDGQGMDHHIATARRFNLLFLFLLAALLPTAVLGQVPTGTIGGRVTDAQDRSIPGVTVTVSSPALQGVRTTVTTVEHSGPSVNLGGPGNILVSGVHTNPKDAYAVGDVLEFAYTVNNISTAGTRVVRSTSSPTSWPVCPKC